MLPLPTELLIKIFKHCEEYDEPNDPNAEHMALPIYLEYPEDDRNYLTWLRVAQSSKQDICNIRLVCKQLHETSLGSFALILGDRIFRLTKAGLRDLKEIANAECLVPWIKTSTFGSADLIEYEWCGGLEARIALAEYDGTMHRELSLIDQAWKNHEYLSKSAIKRGLEGSLRKLPKLRSLRMVINDEPSYLHGWLTPDQREYMMAKFKPGTDFWSLSDASFTPDCCYGPRGLSTAYNVLQALRKIGREIQDLRLPTMNDPCYPGKLLPKTLRWVLPETLCTLHMSFDWFNFECYNRATFNYTDHSGSFLSALENIHILENLALCLAGCIVCEVEQTTQLFQAIRKTSKLRRLDLKGRWIILPTDLITFAEQHALTLRYLVLEYCGLEGTFLSTIHSLAAITRDHLQYLRM